MIKKIVLTSTLALFWGCFPLNTSAQTNPAIGKPAQQIAATANKFLALLDDAQRAKVVYNFKDEAQRKRWSNLPTSFVNAEDCVWAISPTHSVMLCTLSSPQP